jgi:hypothetical protein
VTNPITMRGLPSPHTAVVDLTDVGAVIALSVAGKTWVACSPGVSREDVAQVMLEAALGLLGKTDADGIPMEPGVEQ